MNGVETAPDDASRKRRIDGIVLLPAKGSASPDDGRGYGSLFARRTLVADALSESKACSMFRTAFALCLLLVTSSALAQSNDDVLRNVPLDDVDQANTVEAPARGGAAEVSDVGEPPITLRIGVFDRPPYAMRSEAGWTGLAVDGWRMAAERAGLAYDLVPLERGSAIEAVAAGQVDAALPVDATLGAPDNVSFTLPLHSTTLGVAGTSNRSIWGIVKGFATWEFARIIVILSVVLLFVGAIVWLLERRKNPKMFGGSTAEGLGDGFWWAGVTLTTIGYGDKAPATLGGRAVAMVWMLVGLAVSSALTASIVALTGLGDESEIKIPEGLRDYRVLAEADSSAVSYLATVDIPVTEIEDVDAALRRVADETDVVFVAPEPLIEERLNVLELNVSLSSSRRDLHLVTVVVNTDEGATAEAIEDAILGTVVAPGWGDVVARYLGE